MAVTTAVRELDAKIATGTATVAVVGLGYVGLPLALALARHGHPVLGVEIDHRKVRMLREGHSYIRDVPDEEVQAGLADSRLTVTSDAGVLGEADAVFICVPTPFTPRRNPILRTFPPRPSKSQP